MATPLDPIMEVFKRRAAQRAAEKLRPPVDPSGSGTGWLPDVPDWLPTWEGAQNNTLDYLQDVYNAGVEGQDRIISGYDEASKHGNPLNAALNVGFGVAHVAGSPLIPPLQPLFEAVAGNERVKGATDWIGRNVNKPLSDFSGVSEQNIADAEMGLSGLGLLKAGRLAGKAVNHDVLGAPDARKAATKRIADAKVTNDLTAAITQGAKATVAKNRPPGFPFERKGPAAAKVEAPAQRSPLEMFDDSAIVAAPAALQTRPNPAVGARQFTPDTTAQDWFKNAYDDIENAGIPQRERTNKFNLTNRADPAAFQARNKQLADPGGFEPPTGSVVEESPSRNPADWRVNSELLSSEKPSIRNAMEDLSGLNRGVLPSETPSPQVNPLDNMTLSERQTIELEALDRIRQKALGKGYVNQYGDRPGVPYNWNRKSGEFPDSPPPPAPAKPDVPPSGQFPLHGNGLFDEAENWGSFLPRKKVAGDLGYAKHLERENIRFGEEADRARKEAEAAGYRPGPEFDAWTLADKNWVEAGQRLKAANAKLAKQSSSSASSDVPPSDLSSAPRSDFSNVSRNYRSDFTRDARYTDREAVNAMRDRRRKTTDKERAAARRGMNDKALAEENRLAEEERAAEAKLTEASDTERLTQEALGAVAPKMKRRPSMVLRKPEGTQHGARTGYDKMPVFVNPTADMLVRSVDKAINGDGEIRYLANKHTGDIYVWPAEGAFHADMIKFVGSQPDNNVWYRGYMPERLIHKYAAEGLNGDQILLRSPEGEGNGLLRNFAREKGAVNPWWGITPEEGARWMTDPDSHLGKLQEKRRYGDALDSDEVNDLVLFSDKLVSKGWEPDQFSKQRRAAKAAKAAGIINDPARDTILKADARVEARVKEWRQYNANRRWSNEGSESPLARLDRLDKFDKEGPWALTSKQRNRAARSKAEADTFREQLIAEERKKIKEKAADDDAQWARDAAIDKRVEARVRKWRDENALQRRDNGGSEGPEVRRNRLETLATGGRGMLAENEIRRANLSEAEADEFRARARIEEEGVPGESSTTADLRRRGIVHDKPPNLSVETLRDRARQLAVELVRAEAKLADNPGNDRVIHLEKVVRELYDAANRKVNDALVRELEGEFGVPDIAALRVTMRQRADELMFAKQDGNEQAIRTATVKYEDAKDAVIDATRREGDADAASEQSKPTAVDPDALTPEAKARNLLDLHRRHKGYDVRKRQWEQLRLEGEALRNRPSRQEGYQPPKRGESPQIKINPSPAVDAGYPTLEQRAKLAGIKLNPKKPGQIYGHFALRPQGYEARGRKMAEEDFNAMESFDAPAKKAGLTLDEIRAKKKADVARLKAAKAAKAPPPLSWNESIARGKATAVATDAYKAEQPAATGAMKPETADFHEGMRDTVLNPDTPVPYPSAGEALPKFREAAAQLANTDFKAKRDAAFVKVEEDAKVSTGTLSTSVNRAITEHLAMSPAERAVNLRAAEDKLATIMPRHGSKLARFFRPNAKLMHTNEGVNGGYPVTLPNGQGIETTGMALAPSYEGKGFKTCPNSGACREACLGLTAGQYMQGGFEGGAQKASRYRTRALLDYPDAASVVMFEEINAGRTAAMKNGNHFGVRMNVLSDVNPKVWESLIKHFKDVTFYDYTKMKYEPIAPNHHLTYSSTGVSNKGVTNLYQNWSQMKARLANGSNIAMSFGTKKTWPKWVVDVPSGKWYRVVDGVSHDARFMDLQDKGKEGVIIGLKNMDGKSKQADAHIRGGGFFVEFDPKFKREGNNPDKGKFVRDPDGNQIPTNEVSYIDKQVSPKMIRGEGPQTTINGVDMSGDRKPSQMPTSSKDHVPMKAQNQATGGGKLDDMESHDWIERLTPQKPFDPKRPFEADYPNRQGVKGEALTEDKWGHPILPGQLVAGRRTHGGDYSKITDAENESLLNVLLARGGLREGERISKGTLPQNGGQGAIIRGRRPDDRDKIFDDYADDDFIPYKVETLNTDHYAKAPPRQYMDQLVRHETGHAAHEMGKSGANVEKEFLTDVHGAVSSVQKLPPVVERQLADIYAETSQDGWYNAKQGDTARITAKKQGYTPERTQSEHVAEAIRAHFNDPNYMHSRYPETAKWLADFVRKHPELSRHLHINSFAPPTVGLAEMMAMKQMQEGESNERR